MRKLIVDLRKKAREAQLKKDSGADRKRTPRSPSSSSRGNKRKRASRSPKSGLQYRILKEGDGITPARKTSSRSLPGNVYRRREFDSSYAKGEPARVEADGVIKAGLKPCG